MAAAKRVSLPETKKVTFLSERQLLLCAVLPPACFPAIPPAQRGRDLTLCPDVLRKCESHDCLWDILWQHTLGLQQVRGSRSSAKGLGPPELL